MTEEGPEECHDKEVETLIDVPEEGCDLNPQKTCRYQFHHILQAAVLYKIALTGCFCNLLEKGKTAFNILMKLST